jgi:hypothetical protein
MKIINAFVEITLQNIDLKGIFSLGIYHRMHITKARELTPRKR